MNAIMETDEAEEISFQIKVLRKLSRLSAEFDHTTASYSQLSA